MALGIQAAVLRGACAEKPRIQTIDAPRGCVTPEGAMKRHYKKLELVDREMLWHLRLKGLTYRAIAKQLGVSHTTLSREMRRNSYRGMVEIYQPAYAQVELKKRLSLKGRKPRMNDPKIRVRVEAKLKEGWSPEQIAATLPEDLRVSHETIYQYVYAQEALGSYLPSKKPKRKKRRIPKKWPHSVTGVARVPIPNRVGLDQRPIGAYTREEFGHWEADLLVSGKSYAALSVLVERKTRKVKISKIAAKTSQLTSEAIVKRLSALPPEARRTITYDNGAEFAMHERINEILGTKSYFCQPHRSWEKGSVENMNGLIRRFVPKKTDIAQLTEEVIQEIENKINNRPKKLLGYQTPEEVFSHYL